MPRLVQDSGKVRRLQELNRVLLTTGHGDKSPGHGGLGQSVGTGSAVPAIMEQRLVVRSEQLYNSFALRSIAGWKTCSSGACSICGIVNFRLCTGGLIIQPSGNGPCFTIAEPVKRQNRGMIIVGKEDTISSRRILSAAYFPIGQDFRHCSGNGFAVLSF